VAYYAAIMKKWKKDVGKIDSEERIIHARKILL
jgi:hypothetical protein